MWFIESGFDLLLLLFVLSILGVCIAGLIEIISVRNNQKVSEVVRLAEQKHETRSIHDSLQRMQHEMTNKISGLHNTVTETMKDAKKQLRATMGTTPDFVKNPETRDKWVASKAKELASGSKVLDVSSGNQPYRSLFSHCVYQSHEFEGNKDIVDGFRGETSKYEDIHVKYDFVGDISDTGAPSDTYDLVLLTEVLEHIPEPLVAIRELARVTKPGGHILVTAPFTSGSHQKPYHFSGGYSKEWYAYAAETFDLDIVDVKSQGDFFKLMAQEIDRAMTLPLPLGMDRDTVEDLRVTMYNYMARMSMQYGDNSVNKLELSDDFTIGWMVEFVKK